MSYIKQNFIKGQILKADHLNAMETGIEANDLAIAELSEEKVDKNGTEQVTKENTTFWKFVSSANLFDNSDVVEKKYLSIVGEEMTSKSCFYSFVELMGAGTYQMRGMASVYGPTAVLVVPLFNANKQYVKNTTGVATDTSAATNSNAYPMQITITEADIAAGCVYIGFSGRIANLATLMIVKGDTYPDVYSPYGKIWTIPELPMPTEDEVKKWTNPLYGKSVAFDGDSICQGSSAQDNLSGWAGRIGTANDMGWKNYGHGGGTISQQEDKYWIGGNIETIKSENAKLDYLILEGGTNDADVMGSQGIGTLTADDYSGTYDTTTFAGALETLFFVALNHYPATKIGYIVAQKMGMSNAGYYATRKEYFDMAIDICKKWGIPYINLWDGCPLNPHLACMYNPNLDVDGNIAAGSLYTDGQHLTANGYDVITPKIEAWMKTL